MTARGDEREDLGDDGFADSGGVKIHYATKGTGPLTQNRRGRYRRSGRRSPDPVGGPEGGDFVPFFKKHGVSTIILRNRLRIDGYDSKTDAVNDAFQAIRLVRAHAAEWKLDPAKIGIMGFSAGAELSAPAALLFEDFERDNSSPADPLAKVSARPDFVGVIYPGPTPFTRLRSETNRCRSLRSLT
jgi:hypothetical protein